MSCLKSMSKCLNKAHDEIMRANDNIFIVRLLTIVVFLTALILPSLSCIMYLSGSYQPRLVEMLLTIGASMATAVVILFGIPYLIGLILNEIV